MSALVHEMKFRALVTTLMVITLFHVVSAQMEEGSIWAGGTINLGSIENKVENVSADNVYNKRTNIYAFLGKSIDEHSILGVNLAFNKERRRSIRIVMTFKDYNIGGGVFYRRYKPLGKQFYVFGHVDLMGTFGNSETVFNEDPNDFIKTHNFQLSVDLYPGLSYAVTRNLHLEIGAANVLTAYYFSEKRHIEFPVNNKRNEHQKGYTLTSVFNSSFSNFRFGFRFLLNGKKPEATIHPQQ